jgi:ankyrin repeat protein
MGNADDTENILKHYSKNINQQDIYGCTALHFAAFRGSTKMAELLVSYGADPNLVDDNMESCLDVAYRLDLDEIVDIMEHHITKIQMANSVQQETNEYTLAKTFTEEISSIVNMFNNSSGNSESDAVLLLIAFKWLKEDTMKTLNGKSVVRIWKSIVADANSLLKLLLFQLECKTIMPYIGKLVSKTNSFFR